LEKDCEQAKFKNQKETKGKKKLELRVGEMFKNLPSIAQENELPAAKKIE
jgi:hypothetical protein